MSTQVHSSLFKQWIWVLWRIYFFFGIQKVMNSILSLISNETMTIFSSHGFLLFNSSENDGDPNATDCHLNDSSLKWYTNEKKILCTCFQKERKCNKRNEWKKAKKNYNRKMKRNETNIELNWMEVNEVVTRKCIHCILISTNIFISLSSQFQDYLTFMTHSSGFWVQWANTLCVCTPIVVIVSWFITFFSRIYF